MTQLRTDQQRVKTLLKDTITLLCKNGLHFKSEFGIEAVIGITLDKQDVFLVSIHETVFADKTQRGGDKSSGRELRSADVKASRDFWQQKSKRQKRNGAGFLRHSLPLPTSRGIPVKPIAKSEPTADDASVSVADVAGSSVRNRRHAKLELCDGSENDVSILGSVGTVISSPHVDGTRGNSSGFKLAHDSDESTQHHSETPTQQRANTAEQHDKSALHDNTAGSTTCNSDQNAMQIAYTAQAQNALDVIEIKEESVSDEDTSYAVQDGSMYADNVDYSLMYAGVYDADAGQQRGQGFALDATSNIWTDAQLQPSSGASSSQVGIPSMKGVDIHENRAPKFYICRNQFTFWIKANEKL